MIRKIFLFIFVAAVLLPVCGCSFLNHSVAALRSTNHFLTCDSDSRVLYEPGAEEYAGKIAHFLPSAVQQVEMGQYNPFNKPVRVYVCSSRESFKKYFGADVRAGVSKKLFLSPRIFDDGDEVAGMYLTHELSHLHVRDYIGDYRVVKLPTWYKEGLATYVSEGGGAHTVSEKVAIDSIKAGRHFVPNESGGLIFHKSASDWNLKPHMFYRQCMMFVEYLKTSDESGFQKLLLSVESGERFSEAFQTAYAEQLKELWGDFLQEIDKISCRDRE